jgi:hypothetical protein
MEVDNEYFKSYQDLDIHQLMLEDKVRNEAYRSAILSNHEKFKVNIFSISFKILNFIIN